MIVNSSGQIPPITVQIMNRAAGPGGTRGAVPGRVLHLVTDALPATSAGYTIRTHEIALAQRAAGLDPHVVTRCGYPVTQGRLDGRRLVVLDGVPYHRLLPWRMPGRADAARPQLGLELAAGLTSRIRPAVLHAASNFANARLALALRERYGLPVVYEVRGFWEDTWLSRHPDAERLAGSELYRRSRDTRDPVHAGRRPGGDARRGHAGGDRGPRRPRGEDPHRAERRVAGVPQTAAGRRRPARRNSASIRTSTWSAWCPAWSRTRASARCSRPPPSCAPAACRSGR